MEKIAAKILECKLINHGLSYAIRLLVDFGCQTNITLFNILDTMNFFKVESFDQIEGKYCYVILNNDQWPFEFEQFPCNGTLSIKFSNGTEYLIDRNAHNLEPIQKLKVPTKVIETEVNGNTSVQNILRENILKFL